MRSRIIGIITLVGFLTTQTASGYALELGCNQSNIRVQAAGETDADDALANALGKPFTQKQGAVSGSKSLVIIVDANGESVDEVILAAQERLEQGEIGIHEAASNIAEALIEMTEPQVIRHLQIAHDILIQAQSPMMEPLIMILVKYGAMDVVDYEALMHEVHQAWEDPPLIYVRMTQALMEAGELSLNEEGRLEREDVSSRAILQDAINTKTRSEAGNTARAIIELAEAVSEKDLNAVVLDLNLLIAIVSVTMSAAPVALGTLKGLAEAVKEQGLDTNVLNRDLLEVIANTGRHRATSVSAGYDSLKKLALAVKNDCLNPEVLNPHLLIDITESAEDGVPRAIDALRFIAQTIPISEDNVDKVRTFLVGMGQALKQQGKEPFPEYDQLALLAESAKEGNKADRAILNMLLEADVTVTIDEKAHADSFFRNLDELAQALEDRGMSLEGIDPNLVAKILAKTRAEAPIVLDDLLSLCKVVKDNGLNPVVLDNELLTVIVDNGEYNIRHTLASLQALAQAVKDDNLDPAALDITLLKDIVHYLKDNAFAGFDTLCALAKTGLVTKYTRVEISLIFFDISQNLEAMDIIHACKALQALVDANVVTTTNLGYIGVLFNTIMGNRPQQKRRELARQAAPAAFDMLVSLAKAGVVKPGNLKKIERHFSSIRQAIERNSKENSQRRALRRSRLRKISVTALVGVSLLAGLYMLPPVGGRIRNFRYSRVYNAAEDTQQRFTADYSQDGIEALEGCIQDFERILKERGLNPSLYQVAAENIEELAEKRPDLAKKCLDALERVCSTNNLDSMAYKQSIDGIWVIAIYKAHYLITSSTLTAVGCILNRRLSGVNSGLVYSATCDLIAKIAITREDLRQRCFSIFEEFINSEVHNEHYYDIITTLIHSINIIITPENSEIIPPSIITAYKRILTEMETEGLDYSVCRYREVKASLEIIIQKRPDLARPKSPSEAVMSLPQAAGARAAGSGAAGTVFGLPLSSANSNGDTGQTLHVAYRALQALTDAGVVNEGNIKKAGKLLRLIAYRLGEHQIAAYSMLAESAEAVKLNDLDRSVLDLDLLITIIKAAPKEPVGNPALCFQRLAALALTVKEHNLDPEILNPEFLSTIARRTESDSDAYLCLLNLAQEGMVNKDNLKKTIELLALVKKRTGRNTSVAYELLVGIWKEIKKQRVDPFIFNLDFLIAIAKMTCGGNITPYGIVESLLERRIITEQNSAQVLSLLADIGKTAFKGYPQDPYDTLYALMDAGTIETTEDIAKVKEIFVRMKKNKNFTAGLRELQGLAADVKNSQLSPAVLNLDLLFVLASVSYKNVAAIFLSLRRSASAVKENNADSSFLDVDFLIDIAKIAERYFGKVYSAMATLIEADRTWGENNAKRKTLFETIAKRLGKHKGKGYEALERVARPQVQVQVGSDFKFNSLILDINLLTALAENAVDYKSFDDYLGELTSTLVGRYDKMLSPIIISMLVDAINILSAFVPVEKKAMFELCKVIGRRVIAGISHGNLRYNLSMAVREVDYIVKSMLPIWRFFEYLGDKPEDIQDPLMGLSQFLEREGISITKWQLFAHLLPDELKRQVLSQPDVDSFWPRITAGNYTDEPYSAYVYIKVRSELPAASGFTYEEFQSIMQGNVQDSPYAPVVIRFVQKYVLNEEPTLTKEQQRQVISLSITLHKKLRQLAQQHNLPEASIVTFRELVRFNVDFSKFYLQERGLENVLELFIVTAHNIYGRLIVNDQLKKEFINILIECFRSDEHRGFLGEAEVDSERLRRDVTELISSLTTYADYKDLLRRPADDELPLEVCVRSLIKRSNQTSRPLLLAVDNDNSVIVNDVLNELTVEDDVTVIHLSMNGFTKRQELFGMYIPVEDVRQPRSSQESMQWQDGILVKMAEAAQANPDKDYYLIFENIEACPSQVRVQLNPVIWEKVVEVPDRPYGDTTVALPANLHLIFTMHKDSQIKDPSFMDRPLVHTLGLVTDEDIRRYLMLKIGLSLETTNMLVEMYHELQSVDLSEPVSFSFNDIIEIAKRTKGIHDESEQPDEQKIARREAYDYIYLRLTNKEDRQILKKRLFGMGNAPRVTIKIKGDQLIFDGVGMKMSDDFAEYVSANADKTPKRFILDYYGFDISELEVRVFSQLARAYKYGGKVVQIEGPSGEGKTEIGRVFAKIVNLNLREHTINQDTDLSEFRGQIRQRREGGYYLYEPRYLNQLQQGGNLFMFNEINTNQESALYYWLFPEIAHRPVKNLTEFANTSDETIAVQRAIAQNNLWLFTVNPEHFAGREPTPQRISSHIQRFHMAQDIEGLPGTIKNLFRVKQLSGHIGFADKLYDIHKKFKEAKQRYQIVSPQDITKRELIRTIDGFGRYLNEGLVPKQAFNRACYEVYGFMWKEPVDMQMAHNIIASVTRAASPINPQEAMAAALAAGKPLLVFIDATCGIDDIEMIIRQKKPNAELHKIPLSYFHRKRQFLGGFIPSQTRSQFDIGLGIIPNLIKEARMHPQQPQVAIFYNFTHLNPQVAPLLNEFLQTGRIEAVEDLITAEIAQDLVSDADVRALWEAVKEECPDEMSFARWFYSSAPDNLQIVAVGSACESTYLSPAEIDRFLAINMSGGLNEEWLRNYISQTIPSGLSSYQELITNLILEAFNLYQQQADQMEYEHNRLGRSDIDAFIDELSGYNVVDEEIIKKVAFYCLGMGIRNGYREKLSFKPEDLEDPAQAIRYEQRQDGIYIIVDCIEYRTNLIAMPVDNFLAPTGMLVRQLAAMILAIKHNRPFILEGHPGGGKTASCKELAARVGLDFYKSLMYEDIDPSEFLGRLSKKGIGFIITGLEKDAEGKYVLEFLKAYSEGGLYLLDEGAIGLNSKETIAYLIELSQEEYIDLGTFHPGLKGQILKRHHDFHLAIAQNPAGTTRAREHLSYTTDISSHKIWADNALSQKDAIIIIDYYLKEKRDILQQGLKEMLADIHIRFSQIHPNKHELSPRQLIMVTNIIRDALEKGQDVEEAIFKGIIISYLSGVSEEEFETLWDEVRGFGLRFERFLQDWSMPISISRQDSTIDFDGLALPASDTQTNVQRQDISVVENLPSQSRLLRNIALGMSLNMPIALLEEDGADSFDLIKKFCYLTDYQLHTLWAHPQMTRMHLLNTLLPKFQDKFDKYGIKEQELSSAFIMSLGFLLRHLLTEDEYARQKGLPHTQRVLFFNMMDAIPERQRVLLNEILTDGQITIQDERGAAVRYILPEWIKIVISSSSRHKFSSAFINRFLPIRVHAIRDIDELTTLLQNRYPLLREEEVSWISSISDAVYQYDRQEAFGLHYGFSPRDVFKLAELIQLEKQFDIENNEFNPNPLYYVMKACYIMYSLALEDNDRIQFEQEIMKSYFLKQLIFANQVPVGTINKFYADIERATREALTKMATVTHTIKVPIGGLQPGQNRALSNANGIQITRIQDGFIITTPANAYRVSDEELKKPVILCKYGGGEPELTVYRKGDELVFEIGLIESIGGRLLPRDEFNKSLSLPEDEVGTAEFIRYTEQIRMTVAAFLRFWQRVKDNVNKTRTPRVVLLNGETGTAKTTLMRNMCRVWGIPMYTLNAYEDLKVSDITAGLKLKEGKFQVGIKEFLSRCGTIKSVDGERVNISSKTTSSRTVLLIDEANVSPELLYALMPLFRGERRFAVEYAGESIEVELDSEIMVTLTFNPAEKYSGREGFEREIVLYADKLWAFNPLNYPDDMLVSILQEYHRRGITRDRRQLEAEAHIQAITFEEGHYEVMTPYTIDVKSLRHPLVQSIEELVGILRVEGSQVDEQEAEAKKPTADAQPAQPKEKIIVKIDYDIQVLQEAEGFTPEKGWLYFAEHILKGFFLALANDDCNTDVRERVLSAAELLGADLKDAIYRIVKMYEAIISTEAELLESFFQLRRLFVEHDVYLFRHRTVTNQTIYIEIFPEQFSREPLQFGQENFEIIGLDYQRYQGCQVKAFFVQGDRYPHPDKRGYFEGEFAVVLENTSRLNLRGVPQDETINWAAWHELGHIVDQLKLRKEGTSILENVEVNSMLFPLIFSPNSKEYALYELVHMAKKADKDDYYCQAAKGILNGFIIHLRETGQLQSTAQLITNTFENDRIDLVKAAIQKLSSHQINAIAAMLYQDPQKYLSTAEKGKYKGQITLSDGIESGELVQGVDGAADSEIEVIDGRGNIEVEIPEGGENKTKFIREPKVGDSGDGPGEGARKGAGKGPPITPPESTARDIVELLNIAPNLIARFLDIFAGSPKVIKQYSDTGDEIDIERIIAGDLEPFYTIKVIQDIASLSCGVTIDISGSTGGKLAEAFMGMIKFYSSLFYFSAVRNKGVEFSISGLGNTFYNFLDFNNCRQKDAVKEALSKVQFRLASEGTDILAALKGIVEKYKGRPQQNKLEIVLTDGIDPCDMKEQQELLKQAHSLGIDIVFIGINTDDVKKYKKYINFNYIPTTADLIKLIINLSLLKVKRGILPEGDLGELLGLTAQQTKSEPAQTVTYSITDLEAAAASVGLPAAPVTEVAAPSATSGIAQGAGEARTTTIEKTISEAVTTFSNKITEKEGFILQEGPSSGLDVLTGDGQIVELKPTPAAFTILVITDAREKAEHEICNILDTGDIKLQTGEPLTMKNIVFYELPKDYTRKEIKIEANKANAVILDVDETLRETIMLIIASQGKPCQRIIDRTKDWQTALTTSV